MKCLYYFPIAYILDSLIEIHNLEDWKIIDEKLDKRAKQMEVYDSYWNMKDMFKSQGLSERRANKLEVITWMDSMMIMSRVINHNDFKEKLDQLKLIMEYQIPDESMERVDYLVCYKNKVVILEFASFRKLNYEDSDRFDFYYDKRVEQKVEQLKNYYDKIHKLVKRDVEVYSFPVIYLPEYILVNKKKRRIHENVMKNHLTIDELVKYLNKVFKNAKNHVESYEYFEAMS